MYEMLAGELPFGGQDPVAMAMEHANASPRPPKEINSDIPEALSDLVVRLLAKDPGHRPASADALADEIRISTQDEPEPDTAGGSGETAVGPPVATRRTTPYRRNSRGRGGPSLSSIVPWLLVVLFVVGVVLGGMLVVRVLGGALLP